MNAPQYDLADLLYLLARLRDPADGCPWDLEQDYASIVPSTIEEAYEVADAIERGDLASLREELGDLLFQVAFYSQLASEQGHFDLPAVISDLVDKLVRRHPHVFPAGTLQSRKGDNLANTAAVVTQWEEIKSAERTRKGHASLLDDLPVALPALTRAQKLQKRAARVGFDWADASAVFAKIAEEITEVQRAMTHESPAKVEDEIGDLLFSCVNLARKLGIDSETALRRASAKFEARFRQMESQHAPESLQTKTADQLEQLWQQAKAALAAKPQETSRSD
ncbi:MAG: nucleoside triphosphate pyrophosphohydrolase [Cellvibrionales bacterium]|nr:nucleoside triphosphate pyrophosphohydrolase [Cellvibrionales bacterium]